MKKIIFIALVIVMAFASCAPQNGCVGQTVDKKGHTTVLGYGPYKK